MPEPQGTRIVTLTHLGAWLAEQGISHRDLLAKVTAAAHRMGLPEHVPQQKTLADFCSARAYPSTIPMMLIRESTGGAVGLDEWFKDLVLYGYRRRERPRRSRRRSIAP